MKGYNNIGPVPLLGVEAEVAGWYDSNANVVSETLNEKGFMQPSYVTKNHNWHCNCHTCRTIGSFINDPIQWKRQNDGTLPSSGAEFISSRFPAVQAAVNDAIDALMLIGENAYGPEVQFKDKYDRPSETGLHVHASVPIAPTMISKGLLRDAIKVFYLYYPELVRLSSAYGRCRSIHYRWPKYDKNMHHNFLTIADGNHLEWRIFEADLSNETYLRGALWTVAALTRLLRAPQILFVLEAAGTLNRWDYGLFSNPYELDAFRDEEMDGSAIDPRSVEVLDYVNNAFDMQRFAVLREVVGRMLAEVEDRFLVDDIFVKAVNQ